MDKILNELGKMVFYRFNEANRTFSTDSRSSEYIKEMVNIIETLMRYRIDFEVTYTTIYVK